MMDEDVYTTEARQKVLDILAAFSSAQQVAIAYSLLVQTVLRHVDGDWSEAARMLRKLARDLPRSLQILRGLAHKAHTTSLP